MHRKTTPRATGKSRVKASRQTRPGSLQLVSDTSATAAPTFLSTRPPLAAMTPDEARAWLGSLRERLQQKMGRERAYLDRRAGRGTHTPTDDAYEDDQQLEAELLDLLNECAQSL
jgi:hypothetical protein